MHIYAVEEYDPGSAQDGRISIQMWSPGDDDDDDGYCKETCGRREHSMARTPGGRSTLLSLLSSLSSSLPSSLSSSCHHHPHYQHHDLCIREKIEKIVFFRNFPQRGGGGVAQYS